MADLSDVYGQNFQSESSQMRLDHMINNIANNIAHRQFKFKLHDNNDLWAQSQNLKPEVINKLINKVKNVNKKMTPIHINKHSNQINLLPELIIDTPVEYFMIIDSEMNRAYYIYITPSEVNSY